MTTLDIIDIAAKRAYECEVAEGTNAPSARLAAHDAFQLFKDGKDGDARKRALQSLAYSVGIYHPDYQGIEEQIRETR